MKMTQLLYWLPRVLSIFYVLFLSLFALDVFTEYSGFNFLLPLLIHLIPSVVLLVISLIAWKYDLVGAIAFLSFALLYIGSVGWDRSWSWYAAIAAPSLLVSVLFLLSWLRKRRQNFEAIN